MTACPNHFATFLFLLAVAIDPSHLHVQARESKFFSKVTNHISKSTKTSIPEVGVPVAAPELSPVPAVEESVYQSGLNGVSGDELKGKVSDEELVGKTFNTGYDDASLNNFNDDGNVNARSKSAGGFASRNIYQTEPRQGMSDTRYLEKGKYFYDPNEPEGRTASDAYNSKGDVYSTESQQGMSDTRYLEKGKYFYDLMSKHSYNSKGDVYPMKSQQGMSDTRYLENGKYFYNTEGENSYADAYEPEKQTADGNTHNANDEEFDTMEEYYRKQGIADPQDQGVYVP